MQKRSISMVLLALILAQTFAIAPIQAQVLTLDAGFDPNHVLEDDDIFDVNGMSYSALVAFVNAKGVLGTISVADTDGIMKHPADIIYRVATSYKINPKYLLALIQKEQSLVNDPNPSQKQLDWAAGYGVCDNCSKDDPSIQEFKGFASQLEWAAKQHREKYLLQLLGNGQTKAGKAVGKAIAVDGLTITPTNNATAMLYSYTPHINGNLNLWRIWNKWFGLTFPNGTVVEDTTSGKFFLINLGQKRAFASRAVAESLVDTTKVVVASETDLSAYPDGPDIRFPKYALLRDSRKRIWLLTGEGRRLIVDVAAFHKFGFNEDEVEDVADSDLVDYPISDPITVKTEFPQGVVLQDKTTKAYWYVEDSVRHAIPDKVFLVLYFRGRNIKQVTPAALNAYQVGDPYLLHDGELVRTVSKPSVYVMEDGSLRPIPSADVFDSVGWDWKNVVTVPDNVLKGYPVGDRFDPLAPKPDVSTSSTISSL